MRGIIYTHKILKEHCLCCDIILSKKLDNANIAYKTFIHPFLHVIIIQAQVQ